MDKATVNRLREAVNLADEGLYRCSYCKRTRPLKDGIVVTWGGQVLFALCPTCFDGRPIAIRSTTLSTGEPGIKVGFLDESDAPRVQLARTSTLRTFCAMDALSKKEKRDL